MEKSKGAEPGQLIARGPLVIEKVREEGEKPLCYFKRWRSLSLRSSNYEVQRVFHGMSRSAESTFDDFDRSGPSHSFPGKASGRAVSLGISIREMRPRGRFGPRACSAEAMTGGTACRAGSTS